MRKSLRLSRERNEKLAGIRVKIKGETKIYAPAPIIDEINSKNNEKLFPPLKISNAKSTELRAWTHKMFDPSQTEKLLQPYSLSPKLFTPKNKTNKM